MRGEISPKPWVSSNVPVRLIVCEMGMCSESQQTELYQLSDEAKEEADTCLKSPRMFLAGEKLSRGLGCHIR